MCTIRSHVLSPLKRVTIGPKGRKIIWNNDIEVTFKELKCMVSYDTFLNYTHWEITFTVHKDYFYKKLDDFTKKDNKTIDLLSIRLSKT